MNAGGPTGSAAHSRRSQLPSHRLPRSHPTTLTLLDRSQLPPQQPLPLHLPLCPDLHAPTSPLALPGPRQPRPGAQQRQSSPQPSARAMAAATGQAAAAAAVAELEQRLEQTHGGVAQQSAFHLPSSCPPGVPKTCYDEVGERWGDEGRCRCCCCWSAPVPSAVPAQSG